ncbi:MAG: ATP-dependent DNA helicase [Candidatus Onthovivens sp.]|nr:ATP-dependent DNA helicase [Candidatus Onthovivens sp.]
MITLSLSVHQIVDFLFRSGDIDDRIYNTSSMLEGTRLHKFYQDRQGNNYLKEYYLKYIFYVDDYELIVDGRSDGIILGPIVTIEEIKTTVDDLDHFFKENEMWHLAQAEFYAYIYAKTNNLNKINISLMYFSQNKKDRLKKLYNYDFDILEQKIYRYLNDYLSYQKTFLIKESLRDESLKNLSFPFPFIRNGQNELIESTIECVLNHTSNFVEASTGIGKTISTLYGSLCLMKDKRIDKIFYSTPKNSGFLSAINALNIFKNKDVRLTSVEIIAKDKACLNKKRIGKCNPDECKFTIGYYDKLKEVIKEIVLNNDIIDANLIKKYAIKYKMCPFELSLDLSLLADVIISDYNYIFDPISQLKRYFESPDKQYKMIALIDEAHNMVNRSVDMFSAILSSSSFFKALTDLKKIRNKQIMKIYNSLEEYFNYYLEFDFSEQKEFILDSLNIDFVLRLKKYNEEIKKYRLKHKKFKSENVDNFNRDLYRFLLIYDYYIKYKDQYKLFIRSEKEDEITLNMMCLDASKFIVSSLNHFEGSIFFSATLSPIDYYINLIVNNNNNVKTLSLPSPFKKENFKVLVDNSTSFIYKDRLLTIDKIKEYILTFSKKRKGNYMVFCPSYKYLETLKLVLKDDDLNIIYQEKNMNNVSKDLFLNEFKEKVNKTTVGVVVLGGIFSEGIDLVGDRLNGVIILGIGLPSISFENELKKEYYNSLSYNGFEYAYINVGINKITQALGRLIRSENDKGIALLIDYRYKNKTYIPLFNDKWSNHKVIKNKYELEDELDKFYKN